jgi:hypothetical protein
MSDYRKEFEEKWNKDTGTPLSVIRALKNTNEYKIKYIKYLSDRLDKAESRREGDCERVLDVVDNWYTIAPKYKTKTKLKKDIRTHFKGGKG